MIPIVVCTTPGREMWLSDCLTSINREVIVISDFTFELGKIDWMSKNTGFDRFLILQDSVVIKDDSFFDLLFSVDGSVSLNQDPSWYGCYMGIYERSALLSVGVPLPKTKQESIRYEYEWTPQYVEACDSVTVMFPDFKDQNASGKCLRHGRENLILENDYLIKYKGDWGQNH